MWNLEFKDQLCPQGRTNRVGKQEAAGAARPRIKGSGGGQRGWLQALRVGVICTHPFSWGGRVPAIARCASAARGEEGWKQETPAGQGWLGLLPSPPPLAFQGDYFVPTLSFPSKGNRQSPPTNTLWPLLSQQVSMPLSRLSQTSKASPEGALWCQGVAWAEWTGLCVSQTAISGPLTFQNRF